MDLSLQKGKLSTKYLVLFGMLGGIMFLSKVLMLMIPNVHFLGLFLAAFTLTYRVQALIPLYVFVLLDGIYWGFSVFGWAPNLYIWLPLWGAFMIFGKLDPPKRFKIPIAMILCAFHGFTFGLMYAPVQAFVFGLSFQGMIAWIIAGIPFDLIHGFSNLASGALVIPLAALLTKLDKQF